MDPVTLYHPDGREYHVDTPAERVNLLASGYSETKPETVDAAAVALAEGDAVLAGGDEAPADVPVIDIQHPENYKVEEITAFTSAHPELKDAVAEAEKARGDKARKTITGEG